MALRSDFAVFIISYRRAGRVLTIDTLRKHGYTGEIYIVVSDDDPELDKYCELYGRQLLIYNRQEAAQCTDIGDNMPSLDGVVALVRNSIYALARSVGKRYILVLDDDYTRFERFFNEHNIGDTINVRIRDLDSFIAVYLDFFIEANLDCLAFAQSGDFIADHSWNSVISRRMREDKLVRKAMNSFFLDIEKPLYFFGRMNDDVNMYLVYGREGKKIFTYPRVVLKQLRTQKNPGGITDLYLTFGTYVKSFYSVMYAPSCVTIRVLPSRHPRLHHAVSWRYAVPEILDEQWKKKRVEL